MRSRTRLRLSGLALLAFPAVGRAQSSPAAPVPPARAGGTASAAHAPEQIAQGQRLFRGNCSFCHGSDARGGETGPNLVRSQVVRDDQHGELITPIVQHGRPARGMPKFALSDPEVAAIAAWLHSRPRTDGGAPTALDILVGNPRAGSAYFAGAGQCTRCHSAAGDLAGIGGRYDPKTIQDLIVSGGNVMTFGPRPPGTAPLPKVPPRTVAVTLPSGETVRGTLDHVSAFVVALRQADGTYRSFARQGATPTVVVTDPLQWHLDMLPRWRDADIHDLTAYLATLK